MTQPTRIHRLLFGPVPAPSSRKRLVRSSFAAFKNWLKVHNVPCIGTSPEAETDYIDLAYPRPMVLLMGSERAGLSPEQQSICDALVRIPMAGRVESLNIAVATGILLYEALNQAPERQAHSPLKRSLALSP